MTVCILLLIITAVLFVGAKLSEKRAELDALLLEAERGEDR